MPLPTTYIIDLMHWGSNDPVRTVEFIGPEEIARQRALQVLRESDPVERHLVEVWHAATDQMVACFRGDRADER